jgi:hypothetical protein
VLRIDLIERRVKRVAFFMPSFRGGGAERVMLNSSPRACTRGLGGRRRRATGGPFVGQLSAAVRAVDLKAHRVLAAMPALVGICAPSGLTRVGASASNVVGIWASFAA